MSENSNMDISQSYAENHEIILTDPHDSTAVSSHSESSSFLLASPITTKTLTPNKTISSTTKSWISPFTNWMSFTPESQSKYSMADISPHSIFSSPWIHPSELLSPPPTKGKDMPLSSLFSPSLFSPFNKSMNPLKLEKSILDQDDQDVALLIDEPLDSEVQKPTSHQTSQKPAMSLKIEKDQQPQKSSRSQSKRGFDGKNLKAPKPSNQLLCADNQPISKSDIPKPILLTKESSPNVASIRKTILPSTLPFSSPATTAKPKQPNMSPDVNRSHCNCKKSRCLKLYCECFAALRYCNSCNCVDCNNCVEFKSIRQEAIQLTKERNPAAFQMKVTVNKGHMAGCHCKKSRCLKKYCECFEGSVYCGPNCKCLDCQNVSGSEALRSAKSILFKREKTNSKVELSDSEGEKSQVSPGSPGALTDKIASTPYKVRTKRFIQPENGLSLQSTGSLRSPLFKLTNKPQITSPSNSEIDSPDSLPTQPEKRRRVENLSTGKFEPVYPFFGSKSVPTTKLIALSCLEYLDGPSLYSMSCVNHLWNQAVMDDALWE